MAKVSKPRSFETEMSISDGDNVLVVHGDKAHDVHGDNVYVVHGDNVDVDQY